MSAAACAKVRLDARRAAAAAAAFAETVQGAAEASEMLYDLKLSDEEQGALLALSAQNCAWADKLDAWSKQNMETVQNVLASHDVVTTYGDEGRSS